MLFQITVKFEGDTYIKNHYTLEFDKYKMFVLSDKNKIVNELIIQRNVDDYEKYLYKFVTVQQGEHELSIPKNPYYPEMIKLLQTIESIGSFWLGVKKIHWDNPTKAWIPETKSEEEKIKVIDFELNKKYESRQHEMTPQKISEIISLKEDFKHLIIPMAFFREGRNEYRSFRYINAFFNFYFYLEGLYGKGKTKNYQVKKAFEESEQFNYALSRTIKSLNNRHIIKLKEFLKKENCNFNNNGVIKLIVNIRGVLHHFSQKSPKIQGHPLNQNEFETVAFLLMGICLHTFSKLTTGEIPK